MQLEHDSFPNRRPSGYLRRMGTAIIWEMRRLSNMNPVVTGSSFSFSDMVDFWGAWKWISPEEAEALLDACKHRRAPAHLFPLVATAVYTGMRQGELLNL